MFSTCRSRRTLRRSLCKQNQPLPAPQIKAAKSRLVILGTARETGAVEPDVPRGSGTQGHLALSHGGGASGALPLGDLQRLATVHFVLSPEVKALLDGMHALSRRLATTTVREEEASLEAVRGPIMWGPTLAAQAAAGVRQRYVTAPARRAYDTPENQVLVAALNAIVTVGTQTGVDASR